MSWSGIHLVAALLATLALGSVSCAGIATTRPAEEVTALRTDGPALPTTREDCLYRGRAEIRTTLGDPTASAFSWQTNPEFSVYLDALRRKAAGMDGDTLLYLPPETAAGGNQGVLRGSVFRCGPTPRAGAQPARATQRLSCPESRPPPRRREPRKAGVAPRNAGQRPAFRAPRPGESARPERK